MYLLYQNKYVLRISWRKVIFFKEFTILAEELFGPNFVENFGRTCNFTLKVQVLRSMNSLSRILATNLTGISGENWYFG